MTNIVLLKDNQGNNLYPTSHSSAIKYDKSQSRLNAENVQDAIEEVNGKVEQGSGLSTSAIDALCNILQKSVYTQDQYTAIETLRVLLKQSAIIVATPIISQSGRQVSISCSTSGASIYYTTNGSAPTTNSTLYTGSFTPSEDCTIRAIAIKDLETSLEASPYSYLIPYDVATPIITLSGSTATISCDTAGATIYYTTNGDTPTNESSVYSEPLSLTNGTTVRAIAYTSNDGYSREATPVTYSVGDLVESNSGWENMTAAKSVLVTQAKPFNFEDSVRVYEVDVKIYSFNLGSISSGIVKLYRLTIDDTNDLVTNTEILGECLITKGSNTITQYNNGTPLNFTLDSNQTILFSNCINNTGQPLIYFTNTDKTKEMWKFTISNDVATRTDTDKTYKDRVAMNIKGTKIINS